MSHWLKAIRAQGLKKSIIQMIFHTDMKAGRIVGIDRFGNHYYENFEEHWGIFPFDFILKIFHREIKERGKKERKKEREREERKEKERKEKERSNIGWTNAWLNE